MVHCEAPTSSNSSLCSEGSSAQAISTISTARAHPSALDCSRRPATSPIPTSKPKRDAWVSSKLGYTTGTPHKSPKSTIRRSERPRSGRHERVDAGHRAADDQLLDLGGALVQGGDAHVAEVALDRVVV